VTLETRYRRNMRRVLRLASPVLRPVLRSPAHRLVSHRLMLLSVTGRRTGAVYTFPVSYHRDGDLLTIVSARNWWRNLRDGPVPVTVWLRGRRRAASAWAHHGDDTVASELAAFLRRHRSLGRMYGIRRRPDGSYDDLTVRAAAADVAVAYVKLEEQS
jgi:hypothetical protein